MKFLFESLGPAIRVVVLIFMIVFAIWMPTIVVVLAAPPGQIAKALKHRQAQTVNICGGLGLPTGMLGAVVVGGLSVFK